MKDGKKLKILFVTKAYPNHLDTQNGVFIKKQAIAVSNYVDVKVIYICTSTIENIQRNILSDNLEEIIIYTKKSTKFLNYLRRNYHYNLILKELMSTWGKPDVVHGHMFLRGAYDASWIAKRFNIPYVISAHWSGFISGEYESQPFYWKYLAKKVSKRAKAITAVSTYLADGIKKYLGEQAVVIPNVIEISENLVVENKKDMISALIVADLRDNIKNISSVIKVMPEIVMQKPNFCLNIVGGGEDEEKLKLLAGELNLLNQNIFFLGRENNSEVLDEILKNDFCIVNSNVETFSVFTLESIFSGKPVIATKCGGPQQFITSGNGILIDKNDQIQLKNAILEMSNNLKEYEEKKVKHSLKNNYTKDKIGSQLFQLYSKILNH